jgi:predicted DNA-binding transcriptional regulator AlpA
MNTNLTIAVVDKGYLRTAAAAAYLGIGKSTLERKRILGDGPRFRLLGTKIVVYAVEDLDAWASLRVLSSTSEKVA